MNHHERLNVGFSLTINRNRNIAKFLDPSRFGYEFVPLADDSPIDHYDLFLPLVIQDIKLLADRFGHCNGRRFVVPRSDLVELADDKRRFYEFLNGHGFAAHVPPAADQGSYPWVLKRRKDAGGEHCHIIQGPDDEKMYRHLIDSDDYLSQQYIAGDTEYTTHLFRYQNRTEFHTTVEFQMNRDVYVRGRRLQPYKNVHINFIASDHLGLFERILERMGFDGLCCFNFKLRNNRPIIFEMNPRYGGSLAPKINEVLTAIARSLGRTTADPTVGSP